MSEKVYEVKARHEVDVTYRVRADDPDSAVRMLSHIGLFGEHGDKLFGPCDSVMERHGIEIVDADCYEDPGPTGRARHPVTGVNHPVVREWEVTEEEGDE